MSGLTATVRVRLAWLALWVAALLAALPVGVASAASNQAKPAPRESLHEYEQQLANNEIRAASFRIKAQSLELTLKDGRHVSVRLSSPPNEELRAELQAHGVTVSRRSPSHKRRYILGAVVVVLLLAIGGFLLYRRKRMAREEY